MDLISSTLLALESPEESPLPHPPDLGEQEPVERSGNASYETPPEIS